MADCVSQVLALVDSCSENTPGYALWQEASALPTRSEKRKNPMEHFRWIVFRRLLELDASAAADVAFYQRKQFWGAEPPSPADLATAYGLAYAFPECQKSGKPNPVRVHYRAEATFWLIGKEEMIHAFRTLVQQRIQLPASFFLGARLSWLTSPTIATSQKLRLLELAGNAQSNGEGAGEGAT
jgi:hypothetical protein